MILRIVVRTRMRCRESTHRRLVGVQKLSLVGNEHVGMVTLKFGKYYNEEEIGFMNKPIHKGKSNKLGIRVYGLLGLANWFKYWECGGQSDNTIRSPTKNG